MNSPDPPRRSRAAKGVVPAPPGEVLSFMQQLWALDHALMTRSKRMEKELGITGQQRLVVRLIGHAEGMTPGTLSSMLHFHPSTVTGIVKRLEAKGIIARSPDPLDGRRMLLFLAPLGRMINRTRTATVEEAVGAVLRRARKSDIEATLRLLAHIAQELQTLGPSSDRAKAGRRPGARRG